MKRALACSFVSVAALALLVGSAPGCEDDGGTAYPEGGVYGSQGAGVGGSCTASSDCRPGLACDGRSCQPCQCSTSGTGCVINDECTVGSYCGPTKTCVAGGTGTSGSTCQTDADCADGLRCALVGLGGECKPEGTGDVGATCGTSADCYGGLYVHERHVPVAAARLATVRPSHVGGRDVHRRPGATQAYFRVPRGSDDGDFYRLPFPNDVRLSGGKVSLAGHPTPGSALLGFDVVGAVHRGPRGDRRRVQHVPHRVLPLQRAGGHRRNAQGAGRCAASSTSPARRPPSTRPSAGSRPPIATRTSATTGWRSGPRRAGAHPGPHVHGGPREHGARRERQGHPGLARPHRAPRRERAGSTRPSPPQWPKYAPLRAWAAAGRACRSTSILNATAFTVGHPAAIGPGLATAVAAAAAPTAASWIQLRRQAVALPAGHGRSRVRHAGPGVRRAARDGHAADLPDRGTSRTRPDRRRGLRRSRRTATRRCSEPSRCAWRSPSRRAAPCRRGAGRCSSTRTAPAGASAATSPRGSPRGGRGRACAVLGIDQVEHGTRRGASQESPDNLFYNFANPRGGARQSAAGRGRSDVARAVRDGVRPARGAVADAGAEIKVGPLAFWGHSQGATEGGIAMPYTRACCGAVLSGEGASLEDALVTKTNPVNIAAALPIVLEDPKVDVVPPGAGAAAERSGPRRSLEPRGRARREPVGGGRPEARLPAVRAEGHLRAARDASRRSPWPRSSAEAAPPSGVTPGSLALGTRPVRCPLGGNVTVDGVTHHRASPPVRAGEQLRRPLRRLRQHDRRGRRRPLPRRRASPARRRQSAREERSAHRYLGGGGSESLGPPRRIFSVTKTLVGGATRTCADGGGKVGLFWKFEA